MPPRRASERAPRAGTPNKSRLPRTQERQQRRVVPGATIYPATAFGPVLFNACLKLIKAPRGRTFPRQIRQSERCELERHIIHSPVPPAPLTGPPQIGAETRRLLMALSSLQVPALALTGSAGPSNYRLSSRCACELPLPRRADPGYSVVRRGVRRDDDDDGVRHRD